MAPAPVPVYLDFAATAAIRPRPVIAAVTEYLETIGATPGRGGHRLAIAAERVALECRQALARLLGLPGDTARIAWTLNATHAINTALDGTLRGGDVLVVTAFDHNAVLRCAHRLVRERGIEVRLVPGHPDGTLDEAALDRALDGARLLSVNGASNVLGTTLDPGALARKAHGAGALVIVDTAQVAGELPFDAAACGADFVAVTGHKALLGPQGVGALWVRDGIELAPLLVGGTGGDSLQREMPDDWPDHLQAGTVNAPGIAGLLAGARWVADRTVERIRAEAAAHKVRLRDGLAAVPAVRVVSPAAPDGAPIVTITAERTDPAALAGTLDCEFGVLARPGLHCAPETHRLIGTDRTGALRFSLGWATTGDDVDRAIDAVARALARPVFSGIGAREDDDR
ncbi:MAG: aminotransferase class V-fold PLP-dependent enzyme [Gemmatimonadota bacterium]|jgi:selenocysteine lyase/cysteine desulfurase